LGIAGWLLLASDQADGTGNVAPHYLGSPCSPSFIVPAFALMAPPSIA
jgi:hypothetical protein